MPNNPIGINFIPSQDQAAMGPRQGQLEGVPEQAFKVLSLRLPRVQGARAMSPYGLMNSPGSAALGGNPLAAVFEALLRTMSGPQSGSPYAPPRMPRDIYQPGPGGVSSPSAPPLPRVNPGDIGDRPTYTPVPQPGGQEPPVITSTSPPAGPWWGSFTGGHRYTRSPF
jgi:hypothetical protein